MVALRRAFWWEEFNDLWSVTIGNLPAVDPLEFNTKSRVAWNILPNVAAEQTQGL